MNGARSSALALFALAPAVLFPVLTGCSEGDTRPARDGGVMMSLDGGAPMPECTATLDTCPTGLVCAAVMGVPRCVMDPDPPPPPPPGDGTECGTCPAPGECRMGTCVQPSPTGDFCEFDDACDAGQLCIAGRCTPDPRIPVPCTDASMCPSGFVCASGRCACAFSADCPIGLACVGGACVPGPGGACIADADCAATEVCEDGMCVDRGVCDIENPDFAGTWQMHSVLRIREALPAWLSDFLDFVAGPFRFLSGESSCMLDWGLPRFVEDAICSAAEAYVVDALPPWAGPVFGAIADLNDVLGTWDIDETMVLTPGSLRDSYRGTHTWTRVRFMYRAEMIFADSTDIVDWRFSPSAFNANAVCGIFNIERHTVNVSIGSIVAWAVDAVIYEASGHEWDGLAEALGAVVSGFCTGLADAAVGVGGESVRGTVSRLCTSTLSSLADTAIREVLEARIGASPITLRGTAPITGPRSLRPGRWNGTLLGSGFTGDFDAWR